MGWGGKRMKIIFNNLLSFRHNLNPQILSRGSQRTKHLSPNCWLLNCSVLLCIENKWFYYYLLKCKFFFCCLYIWRLVFFCLCVEVTLLRITFCMLIHQTWILYLPTDSQHSRGLITHIVPCTIHQPWQRIDAQLEKRLLRNVFLNEP